MKKHELKKLIKETILDEMGEGLFEDGEQPAAPVSFTDEDLRVVEKYSRKLLEFQRLWSRFTNSNLSVAASKALRNVPVSNNQTMWSSNLRTTNTSLFNLSTATNELAAEIKGLITGVAPQAQAPAEPRPEPRQATRPVRPAAPVTQPARPAAPSRPVRQVPGRE